MTRSNWKSQRGIAATHILFIMTGIVAVVIAELATVSFALTRIGQGAAETNRARQFAEAGARDALVRLARNSKYSCPTTNCYSIDMVSNGCVTGDGCAQVTVGVGTGATNDPKIITSTGSVNNKTRTIQVSVTYDAALSGQISSTVWSEQ